MSNQGDPDQQGRAPAYGQGGHSGPPVPPTNSTPPQPPADVPPSPDVPPAPPGTGQPRGVYYGQAPSPQNAPPAPQNAPSAPQYGPPAPQYAPPAPPAAPRKPLNLNIPSAAWIRAAVVVALLLGGSLLASGLIVAFGLPLAASDEPSLGGKWFPFMIQLLGLGYGASAHMKLDADVADWVGISGSVSAFAVPLLVPLLGLLAVRLFGRRVKGGITAPSWAPRLALAVAGGLAFATVVTVVSAIARMKIPLDEGEMANASLSVHTAGFLGYLYQFLIAAAVVYVVFLPRQGAGYWQRTLRDTAVTVAEHLLSLTVLLGIVVTIVVAVSEGEPKLLLYAPLLVPYLGTAATGLANLVSVGYSTSASSSDLVEEFLGSAGGRNESLSVFSGEFPAWVWPVALLIALVWIVVMALRWRVRRGLPGDVSTDPLSWVLLPSAYLVAGLALLVTSWASFSVKGGVEGFGQTVSGSAHVRIHLAWWVFFVMALVGLLVEVASRWVAPGMARTMPTKLFGFLTLWVHRPPTTRHGVLAAPGQAGAQLIPTGHERSARAKRWWLLGLILALGAALIVAGGSIAYASLSKTVYGPNKQAEKYLDAIVDGRAEDAVKSYSPDASKDQGVLLTDEVYAEAKNRPTSYKITDTQIDDDYASITYSLTMDGQSQEGLQMILERSGKQAVVFSDWRIVNAPEQSVRIASGPEKTQVNGVEVEFKGLTMSELGASDEDSYYDESDEDEGEGQSYPVLPGDYEFSAPEASKYVSYGQDQSVTVLPGDDADADGFSPTYTQAVIEDATSQVRSKLDACVGSKSEYPKGCELAGWVWDEKGEQPFKMKSRSWSSEPEIEVSNADNGYGVSDPSELGGEIEVVVHATVEVEYRYKWDKKDDDWMDSSRSYSLSDDDDDSWSSRLTLPVTVDGDDLKVDMSVLGKKQDNNGW